MGSRMTQMFLLMFPLLMGAGLVMAEPVEAQTSGNIVDGFEVVQQDQFTQVIIKAKSTPTFTVFKLKNPDRLVVDLIHTDLAGIESPREINDAFLGTIATTQFKQAGSVVSRFIIGLKPDAHFGAKADGNNVVVTISRKNNPEQFEPAQVEKRVLEPPSNSTQESDLAQAPKDATPEENSASSEQPESAMVGESKTTTDAAEDHRVVDRFGDKDKAKKVTIHRIAVGEDNSITIVANRQMDAYEILEVYKPFRVVLDIYGASMHRKKHDRKLTGKMVENIRAAQYGEKVRVVLDCEGGKQRPYEIKRLKRGIQIQFMAEARKENPEASVQSDLSAQTTTLPAQSNQPSSKEESKTGEAGISQKSTSSLPKQPEVKTVAPEQLSTLKDLNFKQDKTQARIILELEGPADPKVIHSDQRSTVLEIARCQMPLILERTLDTSEFGSAIQSLSAYRVQGEDKVKLVAVTSQQVPNRLERREGKLHWVFEASSAKNASLSKETAKSTEPESADSESYSYAPDQVAGYSVRQPTMQSNVGGAKKRGRFSGRRMSLSFKDADIHNVLRIIADVAKLNIITTDDVSGKITVEMKNVPWDQALDIILKSKKLGKVRDGNIIRVAPMQTLAEEQKLLQEAAEASRQLEPLRVRLIPVNYATAQSLLEQIKGLLSERGSVSMDQRTNVLIVKDVLENLIKAEGLIRSLDTETPQVLIEARIVEANTQFARDIGVQWGGDFSASSTTGNSTGILFPNSFIMKGGADASTTNTEFSGSANPGHFAVNLPAAVGAGSGGALGFIFGSAGGAVQLNLRLSALENRGAVKIISAPKITTLDNHKAKIGQGVSIPISVVSAAGVNTQFVEAKLELEVTPHITQEGSILLAIKVRKNEPDFSRVGARGDPTILKKEAETQVMVRDGDTTVIGGIYTRKTSETVSGIPLLSRIPVLGYFFRNTKKNDDRTELLIFITPRIVNRLKATVTQK